MSKEAKEWRIATPRCKNDFTGGRHVYIDFETLQYSGVNLEKKLIVKCYPLKGKKVLLKFKEL